MSNTPKFTAAYRMQVLDILLDRLWHTTSPERFDSILADGGILPEPDIPGADRWKTAKGAEYYPYVRTLKGVSLFDFADFDPEVYSGRYPLSSWSEFVPYRSVWGSAVWIEIDRGAVKDCLISGSELVKRWKIEEAYHHTIMPVIEVAHIGTISTSSFSRALLLGDNTIETIYPKH